MLALGGLGSPLRGQQPEAISIDTLERSLVAILKVDAGQPDSMVIVLDRQVRYVAELQAGAARFSLVPVRPRGRAVLIVPLQKAWTGRGEFEVYPREDGEHVLHVRSLMGPGVTSLTIWRDARATREAEAAYRAEKDRSWSIGIAANVGQYGGYLVDRTETANPPGGTDFDIALLFGSNSILSGSAGYSHQGRGRLGYSLNWFYLEPRLRAKSLQLIEGRSTDLGVSLRLAQSNASDRTSDPSMIAPGVFLTQHLDSGRGAKGISVTLAYAFCALRNTDRDSQRNFSRVSLGLGWLP